MNIAGVVILYHPDKELLSRISSYNKEIKKLFVVDNSETSNTIFFETLIAEGKASYIHNGINEGIAKRINEAAQLALIEGFDWLLTMDQDSFFGNHVFNHYLDCIRQFQQKEEVAVFGIEYDPKYYIQGACTPHQTSMVITSGSLVNLRLFELIGGYDENLFIDLVDFEYCFRAKEKGFRIIQYRNIFLQHSLGKSSVHRSLKNLKQSVRSLHSPLRIYYMTRNFLYVRAKYGAHLKKETLENRKALLYHIKNNLLYNNKRFSVAKYIVLGIFDFARKKMGKL